MTRPHTPVVLYFKQPEDGIHKEPIKIYYENGVRIRVFEKGYAEGYEYQRTAR